MNEIKKTDYLKFIFHKAKTDLTRFNVSRSDRQLIDKIFGKLIYSDNLLRDLFILSHVNEFKSIGKYFIFILKKIDDNVINFENLSQNIDADTEYLENELLSYLSNPKLKENRGTYFTAEQSSIHEEDITELPELSDDELTQESVLEDNNDAEEEDEGTEVSTFRKNYLELIQSETEEHDVAYELPDTNKELINESVFELPGEEDILSGESADETYDEDESITKEETNEEDILSGESADETYTEDESIINEETDEAETEDKEQIETEESEEIIFKKTDATLFDNENKETDLKHEEAPTEKIQLSEEIREELNLFEQDQGVNDDLEDEIEEEPVETETQPTNAAFIEYENEIKEKNYVLDRELDIMIYLVNAKPGDEDERNSIIRSIIETSTHLENISRRMSLEIISNIYQTMIMSFEKIADGKYDMAESTLNLFKKGLTLVISLIKGDDYFGYKDILKSIENIRNALIEEKEKRKLYLKQLKEKRELENRLHEKFPDDTQKVKLGLIKQLIKDTETKLNSIDKITGEYHIYEALRSLTGSLTNFKEVVMLAKELEMKKMVQLAEAGYIFLKFLQNYRINPVTIETKEIFGYLIYNLKSLVMEKEPEDIDVFISYLNDPVKIFSKSDKKKS